MSLLSPWTAVVAAAIALPVFITLYLLRLRRQRFVIPSTLLWQQVTRDLEVNAPIRKLRMSLLFLIQLLLILILIAALGEPAWRGDNDTSNRLVILIDRTASMNANDAPGNQSRLEHAQQLASDIINNLTDQRKQGMAAVLAFGSSAEVVQGFSTSRAQLLDAINAIEPTDEEADFVAALELAGSFSAPANETESGATELVIISDGAVLRAQDALNTSVTASAVLFVQAGPEPGREAANIGFVTVSARRDPENPDTCNIFARLISSDTVERAVTVISRLGSEARDARSLVIPAATIKQPGEATFMFTLDAPDTVVVTLAHDQNDAIAADNSAAIVIPAPRQPRIAIVHGGTAPDPYLRQLIEAAQPQSLRTLTIEAYEALPPGDIDAGREFDLIVFDRVIGFTLPAVPTLSFSSAPEGAALRASDTTEGQRILSWDRQHPLLRHVSLDTLVFAGVDSMDLPANAELLARGRRGAVIAAMNARGARHVFVAFALQRSNWPRELSVTIFLQNTLDHLWLGRSSDAGIVSRPGDPVAVRPQPDARELVIEGPVQARRALDSELPGAGVFLPTLRRAGVYTVEGAAPPMRVVAVAMMSDLESFARVSESMTVNARALSASPIVDVTPQPVWTWALLAVLVLLTLEWFVFVLLKRM